MGGYAPIYVKGYEGGLIQERENFMLPADAFPTLENAYVWRERIKRKQGCETLGRLRRIYTGASIGTTGASPWTINTIFTTVVPPVSAVTEPNASIEPGSVVINIAGPIVFTDQGDGTLTSATPGNSGTINYSTSVAVLTHTAGAGVATTITFNYFPRLPVMGLRSRDLNGTNNEMTVAFDTKYAYRFNAGGWQEFIPGTTWTGTDANFFWSTNYWVTPITNLKLFWVTNFSGTGGDPIRYTDGPAGTWTNFTPTINTAGDVVAQSECILPFRSRLVLFNTYEGANLAASVNFPQRIRWAAIGNPLAADAWRDDLRGKGGFLDIPTSEDITSVGFVRDNLVIYCERSTWQLRYTGRSIAPFQIEKINSELGAESTFSAVQFDTTLVGIGDKGIVECDSFQSQRIDIKIPDLVFNFNNENNGPERVQGIRDFVNRLAFWTYPYSPNSSYSITYPNRRLLYNYENASWAIFTDSFTVLGTFQPQSSRTWISSPIPWIAANFPWSNRPALIPDIVAGNQEGYVVYVDSKTTNDPTLYIKSITGNVTTPTLIVSPAHNLQEDQIIEISGIRGAGYATLNSNVFRVGFEGVATIDLPNNFVLWKYNPITLQFDSPQLDAVATYMGGGEITIRDNFSIVSKKFNFIEEGQNIQIGYVDLLTNTTSSGAISLNMFINYADNNPVNQRTENVNPNTGAPDEFFNITVPTSQAGGLGSSKNFQRVYCPARGAFLTLEWTLSDTQMNGNEQKSDVQIDSQVIWARKAGNQLNQGI